jgi:hypothetical protein
MLDAEDKRTLGEMLEELRGRRILLPEAIEGRLRRAVVIRNWLAHDYFLDRDRDILSLEGRERMISELKDAADFLDSVDRELTAITETWMQVSGVATREQLEAACRDYMADAGDDSSAGGGSPHSANPAADDSGATQGAPRGDERDRVRCPAPRTAANTRHMHLCLGAR